MIPACPKSRATVSDGCAPTLSQYLRVFDGRFPVSPGALRDEDVGTNERGASSRAAGGGREGTHLARSIFKPMCLFPSISAGGG